LFSFFAVSAAQPITACCDRDHAPGKYGEFAEGHGFL
jgi:hypothetical protein